MALRLKKMTIEPAGAQKLDPDLQRDEALGTFDSEEPVAVLLKVSEAGYVPKGVRIRARFSDALYSADVPVSGLKALAADEKVISIATPKTVQPPEK